MGRCTFLSALHLVLIHFDAQNAHYPTEQGVNAAVIYWNDLLSGSAETGAPFDVILGWSLLNEQWYFQS